MIAGEKHARIRESDSVDHLTHVEIDVPQTRVVESLRTYLLQNTSNDLVDTVQSGTHSPRRQAQQEFEQHRIPSKLVQAPEMEDDKPRLLAHAQRFEPIEQLGPEVAGNGSPFFLVAV